MKGSTDAAMGQDLAEVLMQDLAQLQSAARLRRLAATRRSQLDASAGAREHEAAAALTRAYQRRRGVLADLVSPGPEARDIVHLLEELELIVELLATEARIRGCRIQITSEGALRVWADRGAVRRRLFDAVLRELVTAAAAGAKTLDLSLQVRPRLPDA